MSNSGDRVKHGSRSRFCVFGSRIRRSESRILRGVRGKAVCERAAVSPRNKERRARFRGSPGLAYVGNLGGFVADGAPDLIGKLCRKFGHVVSGAGVFGGLLQNVLLSFASRHEVAVDANVSTADYFCHVGLLPSYPILRSRSI